MQSSAIERFCTDCGGPITYRHSYTSCDCNGEHELRYFHLVCPVEDD